jgi:hypothetical protein
MEPGGWIFLGIGAFFIIDACTNIFKYTGDLEKDLDHGDDEAGALLFHFVFRKNQKAHNIFLWCVGLFFLFCSLTFCPSLKELFR